MGFISALVAFKSIPTKQNTSTPLSVWGYPRGTHTHSPLLKDIYPRKLHSRSCWFKGVPARHIPAPLGLGISLRDTSSGVPLTYFNDGGGGTSDFFGCEILAKSDLFGSMKDAGILGGCQKNRNFLGLRKKD